MEFIVEEKEIKILIKKYNVKKSLIKKIEKKINETGCAKNDDDFLYLVTAVISTYTVINNQIKEFPKSKDKLIIGISLDYIIQYELKRKYCTEVETTSNQKVTVKKLR